MLFAPVLVEMLSLRKPSPLCSRLRIHRKFTRRSRAALTSTWSAWYSLFGQQAHNVLQAVWLVFLRHEQCDDALERSRTLPVGRQEVLLLECWIIENGVHFDRGDAMRAPGFTQLQQAVA